MAGICHRSPFLEAGRHRLRARKAVIAVVDCQRKAECWRETLYCVLFFGVPPWRQSIGFHVTVTSFVFITKELPPGALADRSPLEAHLGLLSTTVGLAFSRRLGIRTEVPAASVGTSILHRVWAEVLAAGMRSGCEAGAWSASSLCTCRRTSDVLLIYPPWSAWV